MGYASFIMLSVRKEGYKMIRNISAGLSPPSKCVLAGMLLKEANDTIQSKALLDLQDELERIIKTIEREYYAHQENSFYKDKRE